MKKVVDINLTTGAIFKFKIIGGWSLWETKMK